MTVRRALLFVCLLTLSRAQTVHIQPAEATDFPAVVDSNSPAYWLGGQMYIYNSQNLPIRSEVDDFTHYSKARAVFVSGDNRWRWIESAWVDADGTIYAWYHAEPLDLCPGRPLTAPQIGALVSSDGVFFRDLGIVLRSGEPVNCDTANFYFAGGHGDFTVIPDRNGDYFYFVFTNYGGVLEQQGVAIARMAIADRANPVGKVWKYYQGDWSEPGLDGKLSPILPAKADWSTDQADSFWGPAIHWNSELQQYVILTNHAIDAQWNSDGTYITFNPDISDPAGWTDPMLLINAGWYPQVVGYAAGETDTLAGARARLFTMGHSEWDLAFEQGPLQVVVDPPPDAPERRGGRGATTALRQPSGVSASAGGRDSSRPR